MGIIRPSRYFELTGQILEELNGKLTSDNFEGGGLDAGRAIKDGSITGDQLAGWEIVTALPTTPIDKQTCFFQTAAMATDGAVWMLRYNQASVSAYKWEFIGGGPLRAVVETAQTTNSATYTDLATVGPSVTLPLDGDYLLDYGGNVLFAGNAAFIGWVGVGLGAVATDTNAVDFGVGPQGGNSAAAAIGRQQLRLGLTVASNSPLRLQYRQDGGQTLTFAKRFLVATPIRVG